MDFIEKVFREISHYAFLSKPTHVSKTQENVTNFMFQNYNNSTLTDLNQVFAGLFFKSKTVGLESG